MIKTVNLIFNIKQYVINFMVSSSEFYDVVILTMKKDSNVLENGYIKQAFIRNGISATIMNWDSNSFDFLNSCKLMIIRSCWDYHLRVDEFLSFLKKHGEKILNPYEIVQWNHNKKYLKELESKGVRIPETILISEKEFLLKIIHVVHPFLILFRKN